jgi:hypothetical protein
MTDRAGNFTINNLDAGSFKLSVVRNGYARQDFGQRHPAGSGAPIVLTAGQRLTNIEVRLTSAGNVSGHVRNSSGRPTPGINVHLVQYHYAQNGRRELESVATARSDDRGEYRFYWVRPGRYYIVAGAAIGNYGGEGRNTNELVLQYAYTFFPGTTEIEKGVAIDVRPGGEVDGLDFTLVSAKSYRIRARVQDPVTGKSPLKVLAMMSYWSPRGVGASGGLGFYNAETGTLKFEDVTPGVYEVSVAVSASDGFVASGLNLSVTPSVAATASVTNADVDLGLLTLDSRRIHGRITGDLPVDESSRSAIRISFEGPEHSSAVGTPYWPLRAHVLPDMTFSGYSSYSSLRVSVTDLPLGTYLREALLDGQDALSTVASVSGSSRVELVLSSKSGRVEGIVRDEGAQPIAGVQVVLVPDAARSRLDLFKQIVSDQNGHFMLSGIAPGDYKAFAWDGLEPYSYFDAEVLRKYEPKGRPVRIDESSRQTVDLTAIFVATD